MHSFVVSCLIVVVLSNSITELNTETMHHVSESNTDLSVCLLINQCAVKPMSHRQVSYAMTLATLSDITCQNANS